MDTTDTGWESRFDKMWPNQTKSREDLMALFGNEYRPHTATEAAILEQAENKRQAFKDFIRREIERTAKEEYERAKKEDIEIIRGLAKELHTPMGEEYMYLEAYNDGLKTLEAALETP